MFSLRYLRDVPTCVVAVAAVLITTAPAQAQNGCRTGADALGNAYARSNPMYAMFFGSLESYVADNRTHFVAGADAIRCARVLSQALMGSAMQLYDPDDYRRQQELNAELGAMGISPGQSYASPSAQFYAMAQHVAWLAEVLPSAAVGDYGPMNTPVSDEQRMRYFAAQMLQMLMQDPTVRDAFLAQEPLIREAANAEYRLLVGIAERLAD